MTSAQKPLWSAPSATGPVTAGVRVPGSKSETNRALLLAALADSPSAITGGLRARDSVLMIGGMRALCVEVAAGEKFDAPVWYVTPPARPRLSGRRSAHAVATSQANRSPSSSTHRSA